MPSVSQPGNGSFRRLRIATGVVLLAIISLTQMAEMVAGSFGIREGYQVEPIVLGTLVGGLLLILGIEVGSRWPWSGGSGQ